MSKTTTKKPKTKTKTKKLTLPKKLGQGIIEYGGALIVATLVVIAVMAIERTGMSNVYTAIFDGFNSYITTQTANL